MFMELSSENHVNFIRNDWFWLAVMVTESNLIVSLSYSRIFRWALWQWASCYKQYTYFVNLVFIASYFGLNCQFIQGYWRGLIIRNRSVWPTLCLFLNVFTALKKTQFYIFIWTSATQTDMSEHSKHKYNVGCVKCKLPLTLNALITMHVSKSYLSFCQFRQTSPQFVFEQSKCVIYWSWLLSHKISLKSVSIGCQPV